MVIIEAPEFPIPRAVTKKALRVSGSLLVWKNFASRYREDVKALLEAERNEASSQSAVVSPSFPEYSGE